MGTLPNDHQNDRPGAMSSEHDGSFSRRAMLAAAAATSAIAAVAPISGTAYAAGPDVNSPQDMMAFLLLSEALTGVDKLLLAPELELNQNDAMSSKPGIDPINIKNDYFSWINLKDTTPSFTTLLKFVRDNPKSSRSDIIAFVNAGNDDIKFLARSIVLLWYLGSWYEPKDLRAQAATAKPDRVSSEVVSPKAYTQGLVWQIAGAHPMGYSNLQFGYWSRNPHDPNDKKPLLPTPTAL
ncbi:hypothetical protein ACVIGA_002271 [Bradyrhizobium sp. USDA 3240]